MMYYYNNFLPFNMFGFGFIFMLAFWCLVIWGVIALLRNSGSNDRNRSMEILRERYAKGEITKEQFETIKKDL